MPSRSRAWEEPDRNSDPRWPAPRAAGAAGSGRWAHREPPVADGDVFRTGGALAMTVIKSFGPPAARRKFPDVGLLGRAARKGLPLTTGSQHAVSSCMHRSMSGRCNACQGALSRSGGGCARVCADAFLRLMLLTDQRVALVRPVSFTLRSGLSSCVEFRSDPHADGSWYVRSRSPISAVFEIVFPYDTTMDFGHGNRWAAVGGDGAAVTLRFTRSHETRGNTAKSFRKNSPWLSALRASV